MKKKILVIIMSITCLFTIGFKSPTVNAAEHSKSEVTIGDNRVNSSYSSSIIDDSRSSEITDKNALYDCEHLSVKQSIQFDKEAEIGRSRYGKLFLDIILYWGRVDQLRTKSVDPIIIETSIK